MQSWVQRCPAAGARVAATAAANSKALSSRTVFACFVDGAGGVPHRRSGPLGIGDHLGTLVLDGLELPDRPAELLADLGVRRRGVGRPARDADRLGRQQGGHQRTRKHPAQVAQHAVVADLHGVGADVRDRPQRVDAPDGFDLQLVGVDHHPLFAAVDCDGQHQHRRLRRRGHRPHLAADDQAIAVPGGGQAGIDGICGDHLAGCQVVQQLGVRVVRGDQRAGDGRWDEGAGHRAVAELGDDDREFEDSETLSANPFGEVHTLQALVGSCLPVRRRVRNGSLEGLMQYVRWRHPRHQGPNRIGQVVVFRIDCDGHAGLPSLITGGLGASLLGRADGVSQVLPQRHRFMIHLATVSAFSLRAPGVVK